MINEIRAETQDEICVLTCKPNKRLAKTFSKGQFRDYDDAASFRWLLVPASNIHRLSKLLTDLEMRPQRCIIRGHPIAPLADEEWVRRRIHGDKAAFVEKPRCHLMVDMDALALPSGYDILTDPLRCIEYALDKLYEAVPELKGVTTHAHLSSGAGFKPGIRVHFWFWLVKPLSSVELTRWADAINASVGFKLIDPAPFRTVQIHYTANPIFEEMEDPLKDRRSFLIKGERDEAKITPPAPTYKPRPFPTGEKPNFSTSLAEAMGLIGDDIIGAGFHNQILHCCTLYVRSGRTDDDAFMAELKSYADLCADMGDRPRDYVEREASEHNLRRTLQWVRDRKAERDAADRALEEALLASKPLPIDEPTTKSMTLQEARQAISDALRTPANDATLINVTLGVGKTFDVIKYANEVGKRIEIYVPTHELAEEIAKEIPDAIVMRGRKQPGMCEYWEQAERIQALGGSVSEHLCSGCPLRDGCTYLNQFKTIIQARVVILTHAHLSINWQPAGYEAPDVVFIDENPIGSFFEDVILRASTFNDCLSDRLGVSADRRFALESDAIEALARAAWAKLRGDAGEYGRCMGELGEIDDIEPAFELARKRLDHVRRDAIRRHLRGESVDTAKRIGEITALLEAFRQSIRDGTDLCGRGEAVEGGIKLMTFREPKISPQTPLTILDATARRDAVEAVFKRQMRLVAATVPMPFKHRRLNGLTGSKSSLYGRDARIAHLDASPEDQRRENSRIVKLFGVVEKFAAGRSCLWVTTKETRDGNAAELILPANIRLAHLGNLRGVNWAKDFECMVLEGRTLPYGPTLERQRACLLGTPVTLAQFLRAFPADPERVRHPAGYLMRPRQPEHPWHPDTLTEDLRWMSCEGETLQALGRPRTVQPRPEAELLIIGDMPVPGFDDDRAKDYSLAAVMQHDRIEPIMSEYEKHCLFELGGVIPLGRGDMMTLRPDLFKTEDAAKKVAQRWKPEAEYAVIEYRRTCGYAFMRLAR